jgi:hypothetical protein
MKFLQFRQHWRRTNIPRYVIRINLDISVNKLARAFNFEALLENIDNIFCENCECDEEIVKILLNEDNQRLFKQTFLSESELNIINNINNPIVTTQTESWLLKVINIDSDC